MNFWTLYLRLPSLRMNFVPKKTESKRSLSLIFSSWFLFILQAVAPFIKGFQLEKNLKQVNLRILSYKLWKEISNKLFFSI